MNDGSLGLMIWRWEMPPDAWQVLGQLVGCNLEVGLSFFHHPHPPSLRTLRAVVLQ
jgi:hypothetical protein